MLSNTQLGTDEAKAYLFGNDCIHIHSDLNEGGEIDLAGISLLFCASGSPKFKDDSAREFSLESGPIILPPSKCFLTSWDKGPQSQIVSIRLSELLLANALLRKRIIEIDQPVDRNNADLSFRRLATDTITLLASVQNEQIGSDALKYLLYDDLHRLLIDADIEGKEYISGLSKLVPPCVARVTYFMEKKLGERILIDQLVEIAGVCKSQLYSDFQRAIQMEPKQYLKVLRLLRSRMHIQIYGEKVAQAAYKVGYNSAAQFSRDYHAYFGVCPSVKCD